MPDDTILMLFHPTLRPLYSIKLVVAADFLDALIEDHEIIDEIEKCVGEMLGDYL